MKKSLSKGVSNLLNSADILQEPVSLNLEGHAALTSSFGGIVSIMILSFLAFQVVSQTVQMFNKDSPQIIQINEFREIPLPANFDPQNDFVLAITISIGDRYINMSKNSPFSFKAKYYQQSRSGKNDDNVKMLVSEIHWGPCNISHLRQDAFAKSTYEHFPYKYAFCPTGINYTDPDSGLCPQNILENYPDCLAPPNFTIEGFPTSNDYRFLQFQLTLCNSDHASYIHGLKCTSDNLTNVFQSSELVSLNVFFTNHVISPVQYEVPKTTFLDRIDWYVHPKLPKTVEIPVDLQTVQDYDSYFFTDTYQNKSFYSITPDKIREQQIYSQDFLIELNIIRTDLNIITSRRYTKIVDVISNIGGLLEFIIFVGALIVGGYTHYKYHMILVNELYDFEPLNNKKKSNKKVEPRFKEGSPMEKRSLKDASSLKTISEGPRSLKDLNKMEAKIKDYCEFQRKKKRSLDYSLLSYFKRLFMFFGKPSPEEQLAHKARKHVLDDLNIIRIIDKLKEIDKLKMLLLNKSQLEAFNFIEKPLVTINNEKPVQRETMQTLTSLKSQVSLNHLHSMTSLQEAYDSKSKYKRLYMAYKQIRDDNDPENIKYNEKLLNMINQDLLKIFCQVDKYMEGTLDPVKFEGIMQKMQENSIELSIEDLEEGNNNS